MPVPDRIAKTLGNVTEVKSLFTLERNLRDAGEWSIEIQAAAEARGAVLMRDAFSKKTGIPLGTLSPAGERIVQVVCEYMLIKKREGTRANRTLEQIKKRGLIEAAEASVIHAKPRQGYATLDEAGLEALSYEQIVIDHPEEFSERALWYARRTLGLPNRDTHPPADDTTLVQTRTLALVQWLRQRAHVGGGVIAPYANADAALAIGLGDMAQFGRVHGNIQSRLDFACWRARLPPLGLTASAAFDRAWGNESRSWNYPVASMQLAAQQRVWTDEDFNQIEAAIEGLAGQAHLLWRAEMEIHEESLRQWAFGLQPSPAIQNRIEHAPRLPAWPSDALLILFDACLNAAESESREVQSVRLMSELQALGVLLPAPLLSNVDADVVGKAMDAAAWWLKHGADRAESTDSQDAAVIRLLAYAKTDPERVRASVAAIRALLDDSDRGLRAPATLDEPTDDVWLEGRLLVRQHHYRERSPELARRCKQLARERLGRLSCEACGLDFTDRYGDVAERVIECHHRAPLALRAEQSETRPDDMAMLCANCHRAIHALPELITVEQFRDQIIGGRL